MKNIKGKEKSYSDAQIVEKVKSGDEEVIADLYKKYRAEFLKWANQHYGLDEHECADIFQEVVYCFYKNVRQGRLTALSSTLKTYLFGIGKNLVYRRLDKNKRIVSSDAYEIDLSSIKIENYNGFEVNDRNTWVAKYLEQLGDPCYSILKMYYYQGFSMESIANNLDYKNENVVKSQKLRCIKELRTKLLKSFKREEI